MNSNVLIALFAFLLIATVVTFISMYRNLRRRFDSLELEKESLRNSYDQIRKEKLNNDDQFQQALNQERIYKVAFEDWKSKYDLLELKYNTLKKDYESKPSETIELVDALDFLKLLRKLN